MYYPITTAYILRSDVYDNNGQRLLRDGMHTYRDGQTGYQNSGIISADTPEDAVVQAYQQYASGGHYYIGTDQPATNGHPRFVGFLVGDPLTPYSVNDQHTVTATIATPAAPAADTAPVQ